MSEDAYRYMNGVYVSQNFKEDAVLSSMTYEPEDGDVYVVSYPKCGTTWMQYIVYYLTKEDAPFLNLVEMMSKFSPFLEYNGAAAVKSMPNPKLIKTHLPRGACRYSDRAKYVVVTRNPYDCCVSFYHHTKAAPAYRFRDGNFDEFFEMFLEGKVDFGDYFDHLLSWYDRRNDPNVLFVTYEDLKKDFRAEVLKLAEFLGEEYATKLKNDPGVVEVILQKTKLESMQQMNSQLKKIVIEQLASIDPSEAAESLHQLKDSKENGFVRKGVVGEWSKFFSEEQIRRMKEKIAVKTKGSDVMDLWKNVNLP